MPETSEWNIDDLGRLRRCNTDASISADPIVRVSVLLSEKENHVEMIIGESNNKDLYQLNVIKVSYE